MSVGDERTQVVPRTPPRDLAPRLGIGRLTHHVLFCDGPACCDAACGARAWGRLKRETARLSASRPDLRVFLTRCDCLKLCDRGPIAVVYPDGVWYERVTEDVAAEVITGHVGHGHEVAGHAFARGVLTGGTASTMSDETDPA